MLKRIVSRCLRYLETRHHISVKKKVVGTILEKHYTVVEGSIRHHDYDDAWMLALAMDARIIFDLGCNMGQSSLLMLYPEEVEQMVLVDANPSALSIAAENLITNGLVHKATFLSAFVSDVVDSSIPFFTVGAGAAGSMYPGHAKTASTLGAVQNVTTTTIDAMVSSFRLSPDLIKIDIEGAEHLALLGATATVRARKARFMVEVHASPELPMVENARRILAWCDEHAYRAWYLKDKVVIERPEQLQDRGRCHLLLLPDDMVFPGYLQSIAQGARLDEVKKISQDRT